MKIVKKFYIILFIIFCCISCDQSTKIIAKNELSEKAPLIFLNDVFRLQYAENSGAFLSFGAGLPSVLSFIFLKLIPILFLVGMVVFLVINSKRMSYMTICALSLIFAGGISNIFDRFFNNGLVIDFMNFGVGNLRTGIFNFADLFIFAGAIILLTLMYTKTRHEKMYVEKEIYEYE